MKEKKSENLNITLIINFAITVANKCPRFDDFDNFIQLMFCFLNMYCFKLSCFPELKM